MPASASPVEILRHLGDVPAKTPHATTPHRLPNNTHIHLPPNFSAFDSVAEAVALAAAQGIRVLGVSNYYDYAVYAEFSERARAAGIFPLFGTEIICLDDRLLRAGVRINDPANPGKMYICGKGITAFDPLTPEARELLQVIRDKDSRRMVEMIERMHAVFAQAGFDAALDEDRVRSMVVRRHGCPPETVYLQERHIAQAFQEVLAESLAPEAQTELLARVYGSQPSASEADAVGTQNEIRSKLMKVGKPAYVPETFVDFSHARQLILALGGIPCYPVLADGVQPVCEFEQDPLTLVQHLRERAIHCAEFIPDRNSPEVLRDYVLVLRQAGIVVTAGTEHNTRDRIPLAPACRAGMPLPEDVADLFWEGACVVAAHQYLVANGRTGFVDKDGMPSGEETDADRRIKAAAELGSAVIANYMSLAVENSASV